ncbi:MAG: hypothetical protein AABX17_03155 [Nanoarchaeota archaeon]
MDSFKRLVLAGTLVAMLSGCDKVHMPKREIPATTTTTRAWRDIEKVEGAIIDESKLKEYRNGGITTNKNGDIVGYKRVFTNGHYVTDFKKIGRDETTYQTYLASQAEKAKAEQKKKK